MTLSEFVNTMTFGILMGVRNNDVTTESMTEKYAENFFFLPRVFCKDGFNISIQVHNGNYCASENGVRQFGVNWKEVEWGFPSERIDGEKYNADAYQWNKDCDTRNTVGGYVSVELLDELLNEHGGIDLQKTLTEHLAMHDKRNNK